MIGLIVKARKVVEICQNIDRMVKKYLGKKYSFLNGTVNLKWIRQTKHVRSPFSKLRRKRRFQFSKEIYDILKSANCTLLCSVVYEGNSYQSAIKEALYFVLERFFYFLDGKDSVGMVVSDQPVSEKYDYKNEIIQLVRSSEYRGEMFRERIYQDVFFTRDEWDPLIQVSDLVAANLSSYVRRSLEDISLNELADKHDFRYGLKSRENRLYKMIFPMVRRGPKRRIHGYGIKYWYSDATVYED